MHHEVDNCNNICYEEDPGLTRCTGKIKDGVCSDFDFLDTALNRVMILLVSLRLLAPKPIGAEKVEHTPNKLFL